MSGATPKLSSGYVSAAGEIVVAEITPDRSTEFSRRDLSTVHCLDLDKFTLEGASRWIARAREANRLLPQIVVIAPQRRLSNSDLRFISEEIAPVAVFIDRPAASFNDVLRFVREEVTRALEPERLRVETSFETIGEARGLVVPGA